MKITFALRPPRLRYAMRSRLGSSLLLGFPLICLAVAACGDDSTGEESAANDSSSGATDASETTPPPNTTTDASETTPPGTTTDASETTPGTTQGETDSADTTSGSTGPAGDCQVWEITYDLEGSEFEVSDTPMGAGDQVNVVTMPYDADDHVGPGTFVLRFQDEGGAPGGLAAMTYYEMGIHFVVGGIVTVATDLDAEAGPEECGVTTGMLEGTTVSWMPSAIVDHHTMGQLLCTGALCGLGGLPNGDPVPVDETNDQPVNDFVFSDDLSSFTMEQIVTAMDANSTTSWTYSGTETSRELVLGPACLCD